MKGALKAIEEGNVDNLKKALEGIPDINNLLYLAAEKKSVPICQVLLEKGANPNRVGPSEIAAIHVAAQNKELFDLFLKFGGDINTQDSHQKTPLFYAVDASNIENTKYIISSGDTASHICNDKRTALHDAAERGVCEIAQALIDAGVDVNSQNWNSVTPLHLAARYGRFEMVELLLENGAAIDAQDEDGNTPLHIAAKHNHAEICRFLISSGADHMSVNKDNLKAAEVAPEALKKQLNDFIIETLMNKSRGIEVSSSNLGICVFCQARQAVYTFLPCHHVSLCEECYQENKDKLKFCPMCRKTLKLVKKDAC